MRVQIASVMVADVIGDVALEAIGNYFTALESSGYMRYDRTCDLLALLFISDVLNGDMRWQVDEAGYRTASRLMEGLTGRGCLVPWAEYSRGLAQTVPYVGDGNAPFRQSEKGVWRPETGGSPRPVL